MRGRVLRVLATVGLLVTVSGSQLVISAQGACFFTLGFLALHDLIPGIVGDCRENEHFEASTGNSLQATTGGLMVWRKADNRTVFTNGVTTWLNGPYGVQARPNAGPAFAWESVGPGPGQVDSSAPDPAAQAGSVPAFAPLGPAATPRLAAPVIPAPKDDKKEFEGSGGKNTRAFTLRGGTYRVEWAAGRPSLLPCSHRVTLRETDQRYSERIANELVEHTDRGKRELADLPAGRYYFDVDSTCDWRLALTQR